MSSSAERGGAGRRGILARILAAPVRATGVAASALALVVSGFTGGLEPAAAPGPPQQAAKATIEGKPWNVTVNGVGYTKDAKPLRPEKEGDHWIAVGATVEVTADETRNDIREALTLVGVPGLRNEKPSRVLLGRDETQAPELHPGLPEKLLFFWEIDPAAPQPVEANVQIWGKTQRASTLTGHRSWLDPEVKAHVIVPVQNLDQ
ncbi:hypothetical protein [Rhizomonospora bruguierae]|uniref:hypothetical protein n=1 Tax=Rhizomonospora bruguierae TaxID=1581705 RepID=UPI001BCDBEBD|nr:hypothetical protein [Micromonospora sp. NBRC 107566]